MNLTKSHNHTGHSASHEANEESAMTATGSSFIEVIERRVLEDIHRVADAATRAALGLRTMAIGGALVSIAERDPTNILLNRTLGLGEREEASPDTVSAIVSHYRQAGIEQFFIHVNSDSRPSTVRDWLQHDGLVKRRGWVKFSRALSSSLESEPEQAAFHVRKVESVADADAFARIVCTSFGLADAFRGVVHGLLKEPSWHLFMTFEDDTPIGTGGLRVLGDIGWFDFGATDPGHRMRGSQRLLIATRLRHAAKLGCRRLVTTTGEAAAGDPQHSYGNIVRAGFRPAYTRENYGPPKC